MDNHHCGKTLESLARQQFQAWFASHAGDTKQTLGRHFSVALH
jgi:hypothetical protein